MSPIKDPLIENTAARGTLAGLQVPNTYRKMAQLVDVLTWMERHPDQLREVERRITLARPPRFRVPKLPLVLQVTRPPPAAARGAVPAN